MERTIRRSAPLRGQRVLIVEDDALILMELEAVLQDAGVVVARSCRSIDEALDAAVQGGFDVAILDFGLRDQTAAPVARALASAGIPFFFYTGQVDGDPRLDEWRGRTMVPKPAPPAQITGELARLVSGGSRRTAEDAEEYHSAMSLAASVVFR